MKNWLASFKDKASGSGLWGRRPRIQEFLIVVHADDQFGLKVMDNICAGFAQAKIQFTILDLGNESSWPNLDLFSGIIFSTEKISDLNSGQAMDIEEYVQNGGGLLVAYRCWNKLLKNLFGITNSDGAPDFLSPGSNGMYFHTELFPGLSNLRITDADWKFDHYQLDLDKGSLNKISRILISGVDGRPIAWNHQFGAGQVVYWNTSVLGSRVLRGFILQSALLTLPVGVSSIAGIGLIHVDDFPPAPSDSSNVPVSQEFSGMTDDDFYYDIWLPDMMALRARYGLKYTFYTIMNYEDTVTTGGFDVEDHFDSHLSVELKGRFERVIDHIKDDEFGFHGYNHQPLTESIWPNLSVVESKLRYARDIWLRDIPYMLPASFVPANNWYHREHLRLLKDIFPEITVVSSLYSTGVPEMGEAREFGSEPWEKSLLCLPRETCGHSCSPNQMMMMLSQIASIGIWSHFIHPDDVFDLPEEGKDIAFVRNKELRNWKSVNADGLNGILNEFDDWIKTVNSLFPWLEFMTTSQAMDRYREHEKSQAQILISNDKVEIESVSSEMYYVRTNNTKKLQPRNGGQIIDTRPVINGFLHVIESPAGKGVFDLVNL